MSRRRGLLLGALFAVALAVPASAAPPIFSPSQPVVPLTAIRRDVVSVVVGRLSRAPGPRDLPRLNVDVDEVLLGSLPLGRTTFLGSAGGPASDLLGKRVVAFVDRVGEIRWVAEPSGLGSIEGSPLYVRTVPDWGDATARVATPGLVTLAELRRFLATGQLEQTIQLEMVSRGASAAVDRHPFTVTRDALNPTAPPRQSSSPFPCLAPVRVAIPDWLPSIVVELDDTCAARGAARRRSLRLAGHLTRVDPASGLMVAEVAPLWPPLDRPELETFLQDGSVVDVETVVRVTVVDGPASRDWSWRLGDALIDPEGRRHPEEVGGPPSASGTGYRFRGVALVVPDEARPTAASIASRVRRGPIDCVIIADDGPYQRCRLALDAQRLVHR